MKRIALAIIASLLFVVGCEPTPQTNKTPTDKKETKTTEQKTESDANSVPPAPVAPEADIQDNAADNAAEEANKELPADEPALTPEATATSVPVPEEAVAIEATGTSVPVAEDAAAEDAAEEQPAETNTVSVSSYAPAAALATHVEGVMADIEKNLADAKTFDDNKEAVSRDAACLSVYFLVLGMNDQDNAYKAKAPNLVKASQALAGAANFDEAKAAFDSIKSAEASTEQLTWSKVAPLSSLMKQVPNLSSDLKRLVPRRIDKKQDECLSICAAFAALMQGSIANTEETEQPTEKEKWETFSIMGRNAAAELAKTISTQDKEAAQTALDNLNNTCKECHDVFHQKKE